MFVLGLVLPSGILASQYGVASSIAFPFLLLGMEFSCFVAFKMHAREMWHPGPIATSTWTNDYIHSFTDKFNIFMGSIAVWRIPNRDPRRTTPQLWFLCFVYRVVATNAICLLALYCVYVPGCQDSCGGADVCFVALLSMDGMILVGAALTLLSINRAYDKSYIFQRKLGYPGFTAPIFKPTPS